MKVQIDLFTGQIITFEDDLAAGRLFQEVETAKKGRLTGARGTDDTDHVSFVDFDVDAVEDF